MRSLFNYVILGYPGLDGIYGRDGEKGSKGSKGDRSDILPHCKGEKGEAGTFVYFRGRNQTTVIKGRKGVKGDRGPQGDDGIPGRSGFPGTAGFRGPKGEIHQTLFHTLFQKYFSKILHQVTKALKVNLATEENQVRCRCRHYFEVINFVILLYRKDWTARCFWRKGR